MSVGGAVSAFPPGPVPFASGVYELLITELVEKGLKEIAPERLKTETIEPDGFRVAAAVR